MKKKCCFATASDDFCLDRQLGPGCADAEAENRCAAAERN